MKRKKKQLTTDGINHCTKHGICNRVHGATQAAYATKASMHSDPFGSYTGIPRDPMDKPVQDADDL